MRKRKEIMIEHSDFQNLDEKSHPTMEEGRVLFTQACTFLLGATSKSSMPLSNINEIAFAGRSNVGKSSLINALTGRKTLARTSKRPGRTQQINFFNLGKRLMLVDLPGYGYAKASKSSVQHWNELIRLYLKGRVQLRRVCLLIDSRHGLKESDKSTMNFLDEAAVSYQVILTKCDKIKESSLVKLIRFTSSELVNHVAAHPKILPTSSIKGTGIGQLRAELTALAMKDNLRQCPAP